MAKYILKRIVMSVVILFFILAILFILLEFMPGTPFNDEKLNEDQIAVLYQKYGLDKPLYQQFFLYVKNMLKGDFGVSYVIQKNMPIASMLKGRIRISALIGIQAMLVGVTFGFLLGIISALNHNSIWDTGATFISLLGASIPSYVFALSMAYLFAFKLGWFPLLYTNKQEFISSILPTLALGMSPIALIARFSRTEMIEVLSSDYILLAETKGISRFKIIIKHALRNALVPLLTIMASILVNLMTGSTVIESIFSIPGVGSLFVTAIQVNDYNVVISLAFLFSCMYIFSVLIVDILYGIIDPRIRVAGGEK